MKLKLVLVGLVMLGSAGCVTSTSSYTRDIVYRDGSYYSPADEQNGDYYYEPEYEYSYYDDYPYYGYGYFGNSWYSHHDYYRCRFSYRYDRYCDSRWNSFSFGFGGLTLIFSNSNYYGYPYYGNHNPYYYYGGYPYYGYYSHPPRPENRGPTPMQKPRPPLGYVPPADVNGNPGGVRVPGEPIIVQTKPALAGQDSAEPIVGPDSEIDRNPYVRTRQPRQPIRPEVWRNADGNNRNDGIVIRELRRPRPEIREDEVPRMRTKPAPVIVVGAYDSNNAPIRQERNSQPGPVNNNLPREPRPVPAVRVQNRERVERVERTEQNERAVPAARESKNETGDER